MIYYILKYLHDTYNLPGTGLYQYISFRAAMAALYSLSISIWIGKKLIPYLKQQQVQESVRALGLAGEQSKEKTPTMGGIMIIAATIIPTLSFAQLNNIYIILLIATTLWMGLIGFADDYIKVFKKKKQGIKGWIKIFGQLSLGIIVSLTLFFHKDVVVRQFEKKTYAAAYWEQRSSTNYKDIKSTKTTIPFLKKNEFDYQQISNYIWNKKYTWLIYLLAISFIIIAVSNAANLTDGLDGLAAGSSAIISTTLAILAYLSGNSIFAKYLNIMYIPHLGELSIFCAAFIGACIGFLWYNAYPAQIFMGDTGSLTIGAVIAVIAISIRKELLIPLLCGIFVIENLSVIIQRYFFKYTKKKYGVGKRVFLMAPIHHHYQKLGLHESKIVTRFWIIGILLAIFTLITLKIR